jgi:hypothetical protein
MALESAKYRDDTAQDDRHSHGCTDHDRESQQAPEPSRRLALGDDWRRGRRVYRLDRLLSEKLRTN